MFSHLTSQAFQAFKPLEEEKQREEKIAVVVKNEEKENSEQKPAIENKEPETKEIKKEEHQKNIQDLYSGKLPITKYKRQADNKEFEHQFEQLLIKLREWGEANNGFGDEVGKTQFAEKLKKVNDQIYFFTYDYHQGQTESFFNNIKQGLEFIWLKLQNPNIPLKVRQAAFHALAIGLTCSPGLHGHILNIVFWFSKDISLISLLAGLRTQIIRDFGQLHIDRKNNAKKNSIPVGNSLHVHNVLDMHAFKKGWAPNSKANEIKETFAKLALIESQDLQEFENYFKAHYTVEKIANYVTESITHEYHNLLKEHHLTLNNEGWLIIDALQQSQSAKNYGIMRDRYSILMTKLEFQDDAEGVAFEQDTPPDTGEAHVRFLPELFKQKFLHYQKDKLYHSDACQTMDLAEYKICYLSNADAAFWIEKDGICYAYSDFTPVETKPLVSLDTPSATIQLSIHSNSSESDLVSEESSTITSNSSMKQSLSSTTSGFSTESDSSRTTLAEEKSFPLADHLFTQAVITHFAKGPVMLAYILSHLPLTDESLNPIFSEFCHDVNNKILYFFYLYNRPFFEKMFDKVWQLSDDKLFSCLKILFHYAHENFLKTHAGKISLALSRLPALANEKLDSNDNYLLHYATRVGSTDLAKQLKEAKADLFVKNKQDETPVAIAADKQHWGIVELCLPEAAGSNASLWESVLTHAALYNQEPIAKELLQKNVSPSNFYLEDKRAALHCAIINNNLTLVMLLLQAHADINQRKDAESPTPLIAAAMNIGTSETMVSFLLFLCQKINLAFTYKGKNALDFAIENAHPAFITLLTDPEKVLRLLHIFLQRKDFSSAAVLFSWCYKNKQDINSLFVKLKNSYPAADIIKSFLESFLSVCGETLLERKDMALLPMLLAWMPKTFLSIKIGKEENSLLHIAAKQNNIDMFRYLYLVGGSEQNLLTINKDSENIMGLAGKNHSWLIIKEIINIVAALSHSPVVSNLTYELGCCLLYVLQERQYDLVTELLNVTGMRCDWQFKDTHFGAIHIAIQQGQLAFAKQIFNLKNITRLTDDTYIKAAALSDEIDIDTLCWVLTLPGITHPLDSVSQRNHLQAGFEREQPAFLQLLSEQEQDKQLQILNKNIANKDPVAAADFLTVLFSHVTHILPLLEGLAKAHTKDKSSHADYALMIAFFIKKNITKLSHEHLDYLIYLTKEKSVLAVVLEEDNTLLHVAAMHNSPQLAAILLAESPALAAKKSKEHVVALQLAIERQHVNVVKEMIKEIKEDTYSQIILQNALVFLAAHQERDAALILLTKCKETMKIRWNGQTALYYALVHNDTELAEALYKKDQSIILTSLVFTEQPLQDEALRWLHRNIEYANLPEISSLLKFFRMISEAPVESKESKRAPSTPGLFGAP